MFCRCVFLMGMSGLVGPMPVTTSSSPAAQSLGKSQPTCTSCYFPLGPLSLHPEVRGKEYRVMGLLGFNILKVRLLQRGQQKHLAQTATVRFPETHPINTLPPPLKIPPNSGMAFSHCPWHTAGQSGTFSHPLCLLLSRSACFSLCLGYSGTVQLGLLKIDSVADIPQDLGGGRRAPAAPTLDTAISFLFPDHPGWRSVPLAGAGTSAAGQQQPGVTALLCVSSLPRIPNAAPFSAF